MAFDVMVGGVGDAFSLDHYGTHFLLRKGDFVLGIDCPDHYRRALRDNGFPGVEHLDAMYITHLHGDHVNGLEMVVALRSMALKMDPLPVYGPPEVLKDLWTKLSPSLGQMWDGESYRSLGPETFFDLRPTAWEASHEIGPFGLEQRKTLHHIPTAALRITDGDGVFAYSCDTIFDEELVRWLEPGAEVIFHESTFGAAHTPLEALRGLPSEIRRRLKLVHYPDQIGSLDRGDLQLARQGEVVTLRGGYSR